MSDVTDIDPSLRALDALADDFADPGDETPGCASMWPLLAVPSDALSPLDRDARDRHLSRCARCRVALTEAWIEAHDLAPVRASLPAATALPALPDRRRRGVKFLAGLSVAAAAAASLFAIVFPMMQGARDHSVTPIIGPSVAVPDARPLELVFVVEDPMRGPAYRDAVERGLARVADHVPADALITLVLARHDTFDVLARDVAPRDALALPPLDGDPIVPRYESLIYDVSQLFRDHAHRRAVVILGDACGDWEWLQSTDDEGDAFVSVQVHEPRCAPIVRSRFVAAGPADLSSTIGVAIDAAVRMASSPPEVAHRAPLDLLVLIDGHASFLGGAPSSYDDVRVALDGLDPHVPDHSILRIATATGDTVTQLGDERMLIPLARAVLGEPSAHTSLDSPRYAIALERARHMLDERHDRQRALIVIGRQCGADSRDDRAEVEHQLALLRADGVKVAVVEREAPTRDATCVETLSGASYLRIAHESTAIPGLVFDAVDDFSRSDATIPPTALLHFVHDTLSAP